MNTRFLFLFSCLLAAVCLAPLPSAAHDHETTPSAFDPEAAIKHSQAAIGRQVGDHTFLDRRRNPVRLADLRGKPLVVNLVYTGCTQTCPIIVQTLRRAVEAAQEALGRDSFSVVTVGFDTRDDTPARMRAYARSQSVDLPNWRFLSADADTIEHLSDDLGFIFYPSSKGFDHLAQTTVVGADGRVYQHVYGANFDPPALVEPLKTLVLEKSTSLAGVSGLIDRIRLFCTLYDPASQRYRLDYSIFIGIFVGFASLVTLSVVLVRGWLRARHRGGHA